MGDEHIDPMALLKEEMSSDEIPYKVNAIHRLSTVVLAIGPTQTCDRLVPFLDNLIRNEEDEVLFAIAEELGKIYTQIENKIVLLPLLENLCSADETVVRDQAVKSLSKIAETLSSADIQGIFAPIVIRLSTTDTLPSRISSIGLMTACYKRAGTQKEKIRKRFTELCKEETPLIRKSCASCLGQFAGEVEKEFVLSELIPALKYLASDEQDTIRVVCIESMISIVKTLSKEDNQRLMLPIFLSIFEDKSWKVRLCIARNFPELAKAFGKEIVDGSLVSKYSSLIKDVEADVRTAAVISLKSCVKAISSDKIQTILLPQLNAIMTDTSYKVRAGLAESLCEICTVVKKDVTISKLVPLLVDLLKDEHHEVKMGVLTGLQSIAATIGTEFISSSMVMSLSNLMKDPKWRVRHAIVGLIANLAKEFGKDFYAKNVEMIFMQFLTDTVAAVRDIGIEKVQPLATSFKADWVISSFIPKALEVFNRDKLGYLYRITILNAIVTASGVLSKEQLATNLIPILLKSCKDPVPNVRFGCAKLLKKIIPKLDSSTVSSKIKPALSDLSNDSDVDTQYYAKQTLASC